MLRCAALSACKVRKQCVHFYKLKRCSLMAGLPVARLSSYDTLLSLSSPPTPASSLLQRSVHDLCFLCGSSPEKASQQGCLHTAEPLNPVTCSSKSKTKTNKNIQTDIYHYINEHTHVLILFIHLT